MPVEQPKDEAEPSQPSSRPPLVPPPRHPALTSDPKLVSLLSSPAVMNGDAKGKGKEEGAGQSVWDALERLKAQVPWSTRAQTPHPAESQKQPPSKDVHSSQPISSGSTEEEGEDVLDDDDSGVMVYGPLFPSTDPIAAASDVELAKSEFVSVPEHQRRHPKDDKEKQPTTPRPDKLDVLRSKVEGMWPFATTGEKEKGKEQAETEVAGTETGLQRDPTVSTTRVHFVPVTTEAKRKRVWVPSPDKISVQVMWWGYRMCVLFSSLLPPSLALLVLTTPTTDTSPHPCSRSSTANNSKAQNGPPS